MVPNLLYMSQSDFPDHSGSILDFFAVSYSKSALTPTMLERTFKVRTAKDQ